MYKTLNIDQLRKDVENKVIINKITWHELLNLAFAQRDVIANQKQQLLVQARRIEQLNLQNFANKTIG